MNVALAQPSSLSVHKKSGYLWSNVAQSWVVSTMCGQSTYYSNCNDTIRQISVTPFSHGWYRFAAVLAEVYGQSMLYFQSWKGGVTFGTNRFDSNGFAAGGKSGKNGIAPIEGSILKHGKQSKHNTEPCGPRANGSLQFQSLTAVRNSSSGSIGTLRTRVKSRTDRP